MPDCWHSSASWRDHWAMLGLETLGNTEMQSSLSLFLLNLTHHHFPTIGPQMLVCLYVHILIIEDDIENGVHLFSLWNLGNWRTWVTGILPGMVNYKFNWRRKKDNNYWLSSCSTLCSLFVFLCNNSSWAFKKNCLQRKTLDFQWVLSSHNSTLAFIISHILA